MADSWIRNRCSRGDDGKLSGRFMVAEEAEGVQCILPSIMNDSHFDSKECECLGPR